MDLRALVAAYPAAGVPVRVPRVVLLGLLVSATTVALLAMAAAFGGALLRRSHVVEQGHLIAYQEGSAIYIARPDGSDRRR